MPRYEISEDSLVANEDGLGFLSKGEEMSFQAEVNLACDKEQISACPLTCSEETCKGDESEWTGAAESWDCSTLIPTCTSDSGEIGERIPSSKGSTDTPALPQRPRRERHPPVRLHDYTGWKAGCKKQTE